MFCYVPDYSQAIVSHMLHPGCSIKCLKVTHSVEKERDRKRKREREDYLYIHIDFSGTVSIQLIKKHNARF